MKDFAAARHNMVENQIRTNRVTDPRVIAAMEAIPRERFVPRRLESVAYVDEDMPLAPGRYLMEPLVLARLLQAARIGEGDVVLDIGCASGYSAALIGRLAATVVAVEGDAALNELAIGLLAELDVDNAAVVSGAVNEGYPRQAPYDAIIIDGAVEAIPEAITDQLGEDGRLVAVVTGGGPVGRATLVERLHGGFSRRTLFDAQVPLLPGFEVEHGFVF